MIELLRSPIKLAFEEFAHSITTECLICSPYITLGPMKMLVRTINKKSRSEEIRVEVLTDISLRTLVQGATDISALLYLFDNHRNASLTYLPRIHAKVYISDRVSALVTSANFTEGGETRNFEYGTRLSDGAVVQRIHDDISGYRNLGAVVTPSELRSIQEQVEGVRRAIQAEQETIAQVMGMESRKLERDLEDNLIRARVKNRSQNAIFSDTLLYLLSQRPMRTEELNLRVKEIHADLCDDEVDRVIDGRHYGKLWKHRVRGAQVTLNKAGRIYRDPDTGLWSLSPD